MAALLTNLGISIHAPREGGDNNDIRPRISKGIFQSTPPARGATGLGFFLYPDELISIHAPREGGDQTVIKGKITDVISIHAPREGGDSNRYQRKNYRCHFNPRPPRGGRPVFMAALLTNLGISIHAPREGGDPSNDSP